MPGLGDFLSEAADPELHGGFDLVVSNPPFVLAPSQELTYRDRSLPGDEVSRRTVERLGRALAPGGRGYVLCNWIDRGSSWADPVRAWLGDGAGSNLDAVTTLVATQDVADYAALWNRTLVPGERAPAVERWTRSLEAEGVRRIHVGVVALARRRGAGGRRPRVAALDATARRVPREAIEAILAA